MVLFRDCVIKGTFCVRLTRQFCVIPTWASQSTAAHYKFNLASSHCVRHLSVTTDRKFLISHQSPFATRTVPCSLLAAKLSPSYLVQKCFKSKKSKYRKAESDGEDSDTESEDEEQETSPDSKILKGNVKSTRIDAILKFGLGMSRNKVDNAFYSSKIYVNGEKLLKKSDQLTVEDEVDVVHNLNALNADFLDISRVEVLDVHRSRPDERIAVKIRRARRLTVQNYAQPWKPAASAAE